MHAAKPRRDPARVEAEGIRRADTATLRAALAADFRDSNWHRRVSLLGVMCWMAYEWGPGNETVTPWLLANIISKNSGAVVVPITVGVGFVFTSVQQLASGFTALAGFSIFDRTSHAAWQRLRGRSHDELGTWNRLGFGARCALVFGLGTTAVALIQIMSTGETGIRRHASVVTRSALLCGAMVASIAAVVASLAFAGRQVTAISGATNWMLRLLGNPLFWIGLLLLGAAVQRVRRHLAAPTLRDEVAVSDDQVG